MESPMQDDITYNQIISFEINALVKCHHTKRSFIEKGKLILIIENSKKITISGKNIDASGHRSRIRELVSLATEKGFDIPERSVKHYAKEEGNEYVLVRW